MLSRLFKKKETKPLSYIGKTAELVHDVTVYQSGTVFIDGVRCSVKTKDGSELCKGTWVKVVGEVPPHLIIEKL